MTGKQGDILGLGFASVYDETMNVGSMLRYMIKYMIKVKCNCLLWQFDNYCFLHRIISKNLSSIYRKDWHLITKRYLSVHLLLKVALFKTGPSMPSFSSSLTQVVISQADKHPRKDLGYLSCTHFPRNGWMKM